MRISENIEIVGKRDGTIITIINGESQIETDASRIADCTEIYNSCRTIEENDRETWLNKEIADGKFSSLFGKVAEAVGEVVAELTDVEILKNAIQKLMDFFKEFEFEPNFRFVNTLAHKLTEKKASATDYICSYFELIDSPFKNEVREKIKSKEFKDILTELAKVAPTKRVNNRFKLYYGSQGTGKTTIGQSESDGRCVVCNASMLPADLMEDFGFDSGKPALNHSILWDCMENGKVLVLDEINLLPFDSMRFLQGIVDGKKEFNYKGEIVHINDGFMIIGTMNLSVNGMVYGLPEPLVDRCTDIKKFSLDAKTLMGAII